jgi:hypothetical protein
MIIVINMICFPVGATDLSRLRNTQMGSGANLAS